MRTLLVLLTFVFGAGLLLAAPSARADYFQYPCPYPFIGSGGDVDVIVHGGGQYCDGPMEINGSHYHCMAGGGGIGGGAIGLAPAPGGLTVGGFGGNGLGMNLEDCHYVCPDMTRAPWPNPPQAWVKHLVLDERYNDCKGHMTPAGPEATPQAPESGPAAPAPAPGAPAPEDQPGA